MSDSDIQKKLHNELKWVYEANAFVARELEDALMSLFTEGMTSTIAERGLKELCWKQKQGEYTACDRESNHIGLHSWEHKEKK